MPNSYEDYDTKSATYTSLRRAIGVDEMLEFYGPPDRLASQRLLDSGCGTGNYTVVFADYFREICASDYNEGMLHHAELNMKARNGRSDETSSQASTRDTSPLSSGSSPTSSNKAIVHFTQDSATDMSRYPDGHFDVISNNQVIHHLPPEGGFAALYQTCREWSRMLKTGGRLTINFSPVENIRKAMWWAELIPAAVDRWEKRAPGKEDVTNALKQAGFGCIEFRPLYNEILYAPDLYFNPENFLDIDRYQRCDSTFNLATPEDLAAGVARVQKMKDEGTLAEWYAGKEKDRLETGQTITVFAVKN